MTVRRLFTALTTSLAMIVPSESFLHPVGPLVGGGTYHLVERKRILLMNRSTNENSSHKRYRKSRSNNRRRPKQNNRPRRTARDLLDLARLNDSTSHLLQQTPAELNPTVITTLIQQWAHFRKIDERVPRRIEDLVKILVQIQNSNPNNQRIILSIKTYNTLLNAWACAALFRTAGQQQDPALAAQRATVLLRMMQERYENDDHSGNIVQPDRWSFATVLHVVSRVQGAVIARRLLAWMEMLHDSGRNPLARPSKNDYMQVLDSYMHTYKGSRRAVLIEGFIAHMGHRALQDPHLVLPDTLSYNIAIKAWCDERKQGLPGRQVAEHADRILDIMKRSDAGGLHCRPDVVTYSTVISAWAASEMKSHAVNRVEQLLREIEDADDVEVNTVVLNSVMSAWVKSKKAAAVDRTTELIETMEVSEGIQPDQVSYNTHLHSLSLHANPWRPELVDRAYAVLERMDEKAAAGVPGVRPNTFTYNLVMEVVCRTRAKDCATRAVSLLQRLAKCRGAEPDTFTFNKALSAFSTSDDEAAAEKAEQLLRKMDASHKSGLLRKARPDAASFATVINAYSQSDRKDSAIRAQALFDEMKHRSANGEEHLRPTRVCYNSMIDCWGKSGEGTYGARQAESLLQEMIETSTAPDLTTFNAVLNAWAKSGTRCCGNQAEKYLNRMWTQYNAGNKRLKPNRISYNTVRHGEPIVRNFSPSFFQVINAISKSQCASKAQRALRLLRKMDLLYQAGNRETRPNHISYTAVLNSCAFSGPDPRTRRKALYVAVFTLKELQASSCYGRPNEITYATFIKACANLLHDDDVLRRDTIRSAFQQCASDGQVGRLVLSSMPEDVLMEELGTTRAALSDLPHEWRCNLNRKATVVAQ